MRIALLSDIHGNLVALEAVLARLQGESVDAYVHLGDAASFGPQPVEVLERLHALGARNVMGNTDAWLLDPQPRPIRDSDTPRLNHIDLWCCERLGPEHKDFVRSFEPLVELALDGDKTLLCYHGSPRSNREFIRAATPELEVEAMLAGRHAAVMAGGHTHEQMLRRFRSTLLVNAGSVGQACEWGHNTGRRHYPWAEYAIVTAAGGSFEVEFARVGFDVDAACRIAHERHMPHADWWSDLWYRE
jgi:putative phosphoesterase